MPSVVGKAKPSDIVRSAAKKVRVRKGRGAYVKTNRGYVWKPGSEGKGKRSQDDISRAMTAYRKSGGEREILQVHQGGRPARYRTYDVYGGYSQRTVASTENLHGVKYLDSEGKARVGWLTNDGRVVGEDEIIRALKGLDEAAGKTIFDDDSLLRKFLEAGPKERAQMAEKLINEVDWNDIFKEIYQPVKLGKGKNAKTVRLKASDQTIQTRHTEVWNKLASA